MPGLFCWGMPPTHHTWPAVQFRLQAISKVLKIRGLALKKNAGSFTGHEATGLQLRLSRGSWELAELQEPLTCPARCLVWRPSPFPPAVRACSESGCGLRAPRLANITHQQDSAGGRGASGRSWLRVPEKLFRVATAAYVRGQCTPPRNRRTTPAADRRTYRNSPLRGSAGFAGTRNKSALNR